MTILPSTVVKLGDVAIKCDLQLAAPPRSQHSRPSTAFASSIVYDLVENDTNRPSQFSRSIGNTGQNRLAADDQELMSVSGIGTCFDDVLKLLPIHVSRECDVVLLGSGFPQRVLIVEVDGLFHCHRPTTQGLVRLSSI
jgi:hypothetical protein